jgi:DNA-binding PadR family transcriptional regulator
MKVGVKAGKGRLTTSERALLGLLSLGPMSGYDLRQLIPQSIGHFWSESYGQIYPSLKRMTAEKLLDKKTERGKGRPDRHVYSLTESGREELRGWLRAPVELRNVSRNELLLKVFFGAQVAPAEVRKHVETLREEAELERAEHAGIVRHLKKSSASNPQLPYWLMTVNMGRHEVNAKLAWCRDTLQELDTLAERNGQ